MNGTGQAKDYSSPSNHYKRDEELVREYEIAMTNMTMTRKELAHCVRTEGVNQFVKCKDLREKYFALVTDRYKGMVFPADAQPVNRNVPGLIKNQE